MSGTATWLVEAIERRQLIQRMIRNQVYLFEPQAYAQMGGGRHALIGYQVEGGNRYHAAPDQWFVLPLDEEDLVPDPKKRFSAARKIPSHIQDRIVRMLCQAKAK